MDANNTLFFNVDPEFRFNNDPYCAQAGYALAGGNTICTIYIAVECSGACVYEITLVQSRLDLNKTFSNKNVPIYLTNDAFYTGSVNYNQTKYFYYPVNQTTGDTVIFLNKTGPIGQNGDTRILMSVQSQATHAISVNQTNTFDNWFYPNKTNYRIDSATGIATQPEIIEICPNTFNFYCGNSSCVLVIGVIGLTQNLRSNFRLTAYNQYNKIYDKTSVRGNIQNAGSYQYFWFSSNASYVNPNTIWEYIIAVTVDDGQPQQDVDLFVSAIDARYPTSNDFDFKSDNLGPDTVYIKASDPFWQNAGYHIEHGIVFVVGVKAMTNNANFTLIMSGPNRFQMDYTPLPVGVWLSRTFPVGNTPATNYQTFKWYNWGHRDFKVSISITTGAIQAYMNSINEMTFDNNGYLSIPFG